MKKSHVLSEYLKVNKTTHTIEFERKDSYHFLICGDNVNSQEGLNGSCGIDEIHVVDADLFATLEYMTASRSGAADPGDIDGGQGSGVTGEGEV